ncbi:MAG: riboflavin synthase [Candidatus Omnitrophota bacterium]|nr:riboflavin synthase [Candidatus Omnitrophota bacterium]
MFTGIIEELGAVKEISRKGRVSFLSIQADKCAQDAKTGDSIAVNGVCLTVVRRDKDILGFELLEETFKLTNLGKLKSNEKVNLERSLRIGDRLSGHFVTGHIDCLGAIREKTYVSGNLSFKIAIPQEFLKFIALKGSIAVDGISLTVAGKRSNTFSVYIIPHTLKNTTLSFKGPSDYVNIELDILAKYHSAHPN